MKTRKEEFVLKYRHVGSLGRGESAPLRIRRKSRKAQKLVGAAVLAAVVYFSAVAAHSQSDTEYEVKAAYLYQFANSAEWPSAGLSSKNAPFVIGVVGGEKAVLDKLQAMIAGRAVGAHPIMAKAVSSESEMRLCQLVFIHNTDRRRAQSAIASLQSLPVLLVGEDPSFLRQGGMINLYLRNKRVGFEVNQQALDRVGIRLSPALLQLAKADDSPAKTAAAGSRKLQRGATPPYPELARRMNIRGTVHLEAVVRRDGTVKEVRVLGGNPVLADSVSRTVMGWKYEPAAQETVEQVQYFFAY